MMLIIGEYLSGAAYIYKKSNDGKKWVFIKKITVSDRDSEDNFRYSVAVSGDNIIIGAYQYEDNKNYEFDSGAAYLYSKDIGGTNSWGQHIWNKE